MVKRRSAVIVGAFLALSGVTLAGLWAGIGEDEEHEPFRLYVGGELVFLSEEENFELTLNILTPLTVSDQAGANVEAVPVILQAGSSGNSPHEEVYLLDADTGATIFVSNPCILPVTQPCESDMTRVSWEVCPLTSPLLPAAAIGPAWDKGSIEIQDPISGSSWTYDVYREENSLILELEEAPQDASSCQLASTMSVDLDTGLLSTLRIEGHKFERISYTEGSGNRLAFGEPITDAPRAIEPQQTQTRPYPPGTGSFGPSDWILGEAWDEAVRNSEDLQRFKDTNQDVLIVDTSKRSEQGPGSNSWSWSSRCSERIARRRSLNLRKHVHLRPVEQKRTRLVGRPPRAPHKDSSPH